MGLLDGTSHPVAGAAAWRLSAEVARHSVCTRPLEPTGLPPVRRVVMGGSYALALASDGTVWSWGQPPDTTHPNRVRHQPRQVRGLPRIKSIAANDAAAAALSRDGRVFTWGLGAYGMLGRGASTMDKWRPTPGRVPGLTGVRAISAGSSHMLAVTADRHVVGWGDDVEGSVDGYNHGAIERPVRVSGLHGIRKVVAGWRHNSYAITRAGALYAWGPNVGPTLRVHRIPVGKRVESVDASSTASYALKKNGVLWSWGGGSVSGAGSSRTSWKPSRILHRVREVDSASFTAYALKESGRVFGWGDNYDGQLGTGATSDKPRLRPVRVPNLVHVVDIAAPGPEPSFQYGVAFALTADRQLYAWGNDDCYSLGDGNTDSESSPEPIAFHQPSDRILCSG